MKKSKLMIAYMCSTDYLYEMRDPYIKFPTLYKTIKALKADRMCWYECGITKVAIKRIKTVVKTNFKGT